MRGKKEYLKFKRHQRIRQRLSGTEQRPRLVVHRSLKNLFVQLLDDVKQRTIFSLSTLDKEIKQRRPCAGDVKAAEFFGEVFARRAKEKGITSVVFDRSGYLYLGRIKAFAEALRKAGLQL